MKIMQINTVPNGSTGSIMFNIHNYLNNNGHESYVVWGRGRKALNKNEYLMNDKIGVYFHVLYSRVTGKVGFTSKRQTLKLISKINEIKPDIIHLHNIHGYYINIELLFDFLSKKNIKVIWTLHDCWAFTGHCTHFTYCGCDKWKKECFKCEQKKVYPKSLWDSSNWCYKRKKELFQNVNSLIIVTPSIWLSNLVSQSFLNKKKICVINNGIDTNIFKRIDNSVFRKINNIENKKILLGVASPFTEKKGFNDFLKLSKLIDDDYVIVLVGLSKSQIKKLPNNIIGIERTSNVKELVDIYNSSDIFINPTYEDNYPTNNLEALSCGLNFIAYDTGGCREQSLITNGNVIIEKDINKLYEAIKNFNIDKSKMTFFSDICKDKMIKEYIMLYNQIINQ